MKAVRTFRASLGCGVLAAAFLVAPPAWSCGYHDPSTLNVGMLNLAYPDALFVRTAVWMAQRDGLIPGHLEATTRGPSQVGQGAMYGLLNTVASLGQLRDRLDLAIEGRPLPAFSVVLMQPMLWARFERVGDTLNLQPHAKGPAITDVVVVTDEPVVEALLDGRLSPQDAQARGLFRLYGPPEDVANVSSLLGRFTAGPVADADARAPAAPPVP